MTANEILQKLSELGSESTRRIFSNHGNPHSMYGVKIEELKKIQKKVKKDHDLAIALFESDNSDAMYLAGLIADEEKISKKELNQWASQARWSMISEYPVAWVAAESRFAWELANEWIDSDKENIASAGWATLSNYVAITNDEGLDMEALNKLLKRVEKEIHSSPNRVRYTMNGFVISLSAYVPQFIEEGIEAGKRIGKVSVNVGNTACKVPYSPEYIQKMMKAGRTGKKKKAARC